jgi:hypothetical protein
MNCRDITWVTRPRNRTKEGRWDYQAASDTHEQERQASRLEEGTASRLTDLALLFCFGLLYCNINTLKVPWES